MSGLAMTLVRVRARLEEIVTAPMKQPAPHLIDVAVLQREQRARAVECGRELGRAVRELEETDSEFAELQAKSIHRWGCVFAARCPAAEAELADHGGGGPLTGRPRREPFASMGPPGEYRPSGMFGPEPFRMGA